MDSGDFLDRADMDPKSLSKSCVVEHAVRRYKKPSVVWLNPRWLIEEGIDPTNEQEVMDFESSVLTKYAVGRPTDDQDDGSFFEEEQVFHADRYGATGGSYFGGSGRCSIKDRFLLKGTGQTALTSRFADDDHRNGLLELGEALRETIFSELFYQEMPNRSIPVLALIDTGTTAYFSEDKCEKRAAIMVRPFFVRVAHFERSVFFDHNPVIGHSSQPEDADRVSFYLRYASRKNRSFLESMWSKVLQQKAAERVLRLWSGRFLTSNMGFEGRSLDFGMSSTLPSWHRFVHHSQECFGQDTEALLYAMRSTFVQASKYLRASPGPTTRNPGNNSTAELNKGATEKHIDNELRKHFRTTLHQILPDVLFDKPEYKDEFVEALQHEYEREQKVPVPLLSEDGVGELENASVENREFVRTFVTRTYGKNGFRNSRQSASEREICADYLRFVFSNRPDTYYSKIRLDCSSLCDSLTACAETNKKLITQFINSRLSSSRRFWKFLPTPILVNSVESDSTSSLVHGSTVHSPEGTIYVEGQILDDSILVLGKKVSLLNLGKYEVSNDGSCWAGFVPVEKFSAVAEGR